MYCHNSNQHLFCVTRGVTLNASKLKTETLLSINLRRAKIVVFVHNIIHNYLEFCH